MAQNVTIDTSAYADGAILTEAKLDTTFAAVETVIEGILNGGQAFDSVLLNATAEAVTISGGVVTVTRAYAELNAQTGSSDDLDTITITDGKFAFLRAATGDTITLKHGTGNISCIGNADIAISGNDTVLIFSDGSQVGVIGDAGSGGAGITGSTGATDNRLIRADGTGGSTVQSSGITVDDSANMSGVNTLGLVDATELTISSGAVTRTATYHRIDTQADAATDDLDTISGGTAGQKLILRAENTARTVVIRHNGGGTGNIRTFSGNSITLDETYKSVELIYDGTNWLVLGMSTSSGATVVTANKVYKSGSLYTSTSGTMTDVDATNAAITITATGSGKALVIFSFIANKATAGSGYYRITDGTNHSDEVQNEFATITGNGITLMWEFTTSAGSTTYKLQYRTSDANAVQVRNERAISMVVQEIA
jgi:hypothetical protein